MRCTCLLWLLWLLCIACLPVAAAEPERPNIIFIMADDLGYADVGCYGQKEIRTPHIDALAREGRRFTQCYAGCTVCAPSRSVLMTGLHTGHTRVRGNFGKTGGVGPQGRVPLSDEDVTVAEVLKAAGYTTGITGKWGLGEPETAGVPNRQGFDEWLGYLNQRAAHSYYPPYLWKNEEKLPLPGNLEGKRGTYTHDLFTEFALEFIERHSKRPSKNNFAFRVGKPSPPAPLPQAGEGSSCSTASKVRRPEVETKPFFLYMAYTIPHGNYEVPSDAPYSDKPWSAKLKNYAAMVTRLDGDVGRIMALLAKLDIDRRTIVFFTSDNGAAFVEPTFNSSGRLRGQKRDMYEGGIRVPMIVRRPGRVKPGSSSDQVWAFWDFLPTCAELAGAELPKDIDGISMLPAILDKPQQSHEFLYWEFFERGFQQAVRHGDFKAIRPALGKPLQLYNLAEDPSESQNVAAEHPEEVARIEAYLKTARSESENWPLPKK